MCNCFKAQKSRQHKHFSLPSEFQKLKDVRIHNGTLSFDLSITQVYHVRPLTKHTHTKDVPSENLIGALHVMKSVCA